LRSNLYIFSMKGDRVMRDLIKGAVICAVVSAVVTVGVTALIGLCGEPEHSIIRTIRTDREAPATETDPRCAPVFIKMPCLQPSASQRRAAS
jgi:hypothetical protein